jgi:hypothetical protein
MAHGVGVGIVLLCALSALPALACTISAAVISGLQVNVVATVNISEDFRISELLAVYGNYPVGQIGIGFGDGKSESHNSFSWNTTYTYSPGTYDATCQGTIVIYSTGGSALYTSTSSNYTGNFTLTTPTVSTEPPPTLPPTPPPPTPPPLSNPPTATLTAVSANNTRFMSSGKAAGTIAGTAADDVRVTELQVAIRRVVNVASPDQCGAGSANFDWNGSAWVHACGALNATLSSGTTDRTWSYASTPALADMTGGTMYRIYVNAYDDDGNSTGW